MSSADHALYANHRRFLQAQRGALTQHDGFDVIHGDVPSFQIAMLNDARAAADAKTHAAFVFAPPWADPGVDAFASLAYQLTHMSLPRTKISPPPAQSGLTIERVSDESGLRAFTEVQAAGFVAKPEAYDDLFAWMWDKNQRALPLDDQHYYCLRRDGTPVSVLLTVDAGDALGIYAVATPPALRRRGLSSYLLSHVCAQTTPGVQVCLQVMRGSDAQRLYTKLGFEKRFIVNVYAV